MKQTSSEYPTRAKKAEALMRDICRGPWGDQTLARFLECLFATGQETLAKYIRDEAVNDNIPKSELQGK